LTVGRISVLLLILVASPLRAQTPDRPEDLARWSLIPSIQALAVYEDNLLVTAGPTTKGAFGRLTPSLATRYRGPLGFFDVGYAFDSERHKRELKILDDVLARQIGTLNFESRPTERSLVSGHMRYLSTTRPEEVLEETGLVASERRTTSLVANLVTERKVSEASRASVGYTATLDDFGQATESRPGARSVLQSAFIGVRRQRSERMTIGGEYDVKLLNGEERTFRAVTDGVFWSQSAGIRLTESLAPHVSISVFAGPRFAQTVPATIVPATVVPIAWQLKPEVRSSLTYRNLDNFLSITYARSQEIGYGASGFIDTESIELRGARVVGRRLQLAGRPAFYRNSLAGQRADSYRLEGTAHYVISSWLTLDGVFSYRYQNRALALSDLEITSVGQSRKRTRAAVGMTLQRPISMK